MKLVKLLWTLMFPVMLLSAPGQTMADAEREARQAELDAACEQARQERLAPLRKIKIEACINNGEYASAAECEAQYLNYGERAGNRQALFYDLPACVEAFEFAQSERSGG